MKNGPESAQDQDGQHDESSTLTTEHQYLVGEDDRLVHSVLSFSVLGALMVYALEAARAVRCGADEAKTSD